MTQSFPPNGDEPSPRAVGDKLNHIFVEIARLHGKIDSALSVRNELTEHKREVLGHLDEIDKRLAALDLAQALAAGRLGAGRWAFDLLWGLGLAIISAGVWFR